MNTLKKRTMSVLFGAALCQAALASELSAALPVPHHLSMVDGDPDGAQVLLAARRYAAFWHTGDARYAAAALAPDFIDRTLPAGRSQGTAGPIEASHAFRAAVPDLTAEIDDMVVAGDRAAVHLHFRGHFTGRFGEQVGTGQAVDFQAFDLYRVAEGRIAENWHLEDNLTVLKQLGAIKP